MNKNALLGIILIIIGILWTLSNFNLFTDQWLLPFIGIVLFAAYFYRGGIQKKGSVGFLIAGSIIFMVGLFAIINDNTYLGPLEGSLFFLLVGLAFLPVYFIHTRCLPGPEGSHQKWPLFTGLIIMAFGLFVLFTETYHIPVMRRITSMIWPSALIIIGLYVMLKRK